MAFMKLVDTIPTTIEFSPIPEYTAPEDQKRLLKYTIDGTLHIIKPYKKHLYNIPLNNISSADASQIVTWWESLTVLSFYPDLTNTPDTYYAVNITNTEAPLSLMFPFPDIYEGALQIREV